MNENNGYPQKNNDTCVCDKNAKQNETNKRQNVNECSCQEKRERLLKQASETWQNGKISEEDLQEIYRNACTGKESVEILKSFSSDKGFRNLLIRQHKEYATIAKEIELYANQVGYCLEKTSMFAKIMMYMTTMMSTMKDKSSSKLSEIMMQGINMGIIALTKLNNKLSEQNRTCPLSDTLLNLLTKNLEEMKLFL